MGIWLPKAKLQMAYLDAQIHWRGRVISRSSIEEAFQNNKEAVRVRVLIQSFSV